jgi:hypothetical protein
MAGLHPRRTSSHAPKTALRALVLTLALVAVLAVAAWGAFVYVVEQRVLQALGPRAHVGSIRYVYPVLELRDARITSVGAPYAWPASDEVRVSRVTFEARLSDLWAAHRGAPLRIPEVTIEDGTLSMLRLPGHLMLLPALREQARAHAAGQPGERGSAAEATVGVSSPVPAANALDERAASSAGYSTPYPRPGPPPGSPPPEERPVTLILEHVHVEHLDVALYDATVDRAKPYRIVLADGRADLGHIALPAVAQPMTLDLQAGREGPGSSGRVAVKGSLAPAEHDADLVIDLTNGDLVLLQPYLLRFGENGVRSGRMDLHLEAHVAHGAIHAPGRLGIADLQFNDNAGTFVGVERRAVLGALTKDGRLDVRFTLDGRLDDPKFALNEKLGGRIAVGLADAVGVSVKNAVQSVGDAIKGLLGGGTPPARKP